MKISIQMISLGTNEFFFLFDHEHRPVIEVRGVQYHSLDSLHQAFPQLLLPENLAIFAQMANFIAKGIEFQYIEDIESFKSSYYQQLEEEHSPLLHEERKLKDFGIFDLSAMHLPTLNNQQFVFFVKHDYLGIPYRVSISTHKRPFEMNDIYYELLPQT